MVRNDQWLPYSSDLAAELKKDERTNRGSFGDALDELLEVLKNLEASTVSDQGTPSTSSAPAPRMLGKVSAKKLFEDEMLNEKAFRDKMFKLDGFFRCRQCTMRFRQWRIGIRVFGTFALILWVLRSF